MKIIELQNKITHIINNTEIVKVKLQEICDLLKNEIEHYNWIGFYFTNENKEELKLAQFSGKPTQHTVISFGKGICGQVALSNKNFVVQDVNEQDNYISCGLEVKSEIVIPIFKNGKNIGQIDIDSHHQSPFTKKDEELLEFVCEQVSQLDINIS